MKPFLTLLFLATISIAVAQTDFDPITEGMECTSITIGKKASADGSVMTSHTDDSHRSRTNIMVEPAMDHQPGETEGMYWRRWAKKVPGNPSWRLKTVPRWPPSNSSTNTMPPVC